eukprot:scaffold126208_cov45-Phaeocystis_antarctica.AAC.2
MAHSLSANDEMVRRLASGSIPSGVRQGLPSLTLTTHHSPLTTHHAPLATRRSPLTTHHSPLTTRPHPHHHVHPHPHPQLSPLTTHILSLASTLILTADDLQLATDGLQPWLGLGLACNPG